VADFVIVQPEILQVVEGSQNTIWDSDQFIAGKIQTDHITGECWLLLQIFSFADNLKRTNKKS
jgi:hypothetical protein